MKDIVVVLLFRTGKKTISLLISERIWLSIVRDCYGSYRINMQFHRGRCSGLHHASVRTDDLLGYFLLSPKASPTITNLSFLLPALSPLLVFTGFHHSCWQKFSILLWRTVRFLTLLICSSWRDQNHKPCWETVFYQLQLCYLWPQDLRTVTLTIAKDCLNLLS